MTTKFATKIGLSMLVLGLAAVPAMAQTAAAPAKAAPAMHHAAGHKAIAAKKGTPAHDSMADQLNAQSLSAAQSGTVFTPPGAAPNAAPVPAAQRKKM